MLYLLRDVIWHKWRGIVVTIFTLFTVYSAVVEHGFPDAGLPTMKDLLPVWDWWIWVLMGLAVLWVSTFVLAYQQRRLLQSHNNWIVAYKALHGKLPVIPAHLLPLVDNYSSEKPISKEIKVKTSLQYWHGLLDDSREQFLQIIDWISEDRQAYLQHMRDTAPPGGKPRTKRSSFSFGK